MLRRFGEPKCLSPGRASRNKSRHRLGRARAGDRTSPILVIAVLLATTTMVMGPKAGAAQPSDVLTVADYAFSTAYHSRPPQFVTAADVANAVGTVPVNKANITLVFNIGDVLDYPRIVMFENDATFKQSCVDFSPKVGRRPTVIPCPANVVAVWSELPFVLNASRSAVADAASSGRAVSGANVAQFFNGSNYILRQQPTFRAGQGGIVAITWKLKVNGDLTSSVVCVRFPKTEAGIPMQVACK